MKKTFKIRGTEFQLTDADVKQVATSMSSGVTERVRFYVKVQGQLFPVRQFLVELVKRKGGMVPDVTSHEAIRVLRALGFEITEA